MKHKKARKFLLGLGLALLLLTVFACGICTHPVFAADGDVRSHYGSSDDDNDGLVAFIRNLGEKVETLINTLQKAFTGELLYEMFFTSVQRSLDGWLRPVEGVFDKLFLHTPSLTVFPWIHTAWSQCVWFGLGLLAIAVCALGVRAVVTADYGRVRENIKVVVLALGGSLASLWFCEMLIRIQNRVWEDIIGSYMVEAGTSGGVSMAPLRMAFAGVSEQAAEEGFSAAKMFAMIGHPDTAAVAGSLFFMIIGVFLAAILAFFILAHYFVLMGLVVIAPLYLNGAAVTGRSEAVVGWANLFVRTLLVQSMCCGAWVAMMALQLACGPGSADPLHKYLGVGVLLLNLIIMTLLIVLIFKYWFLHAIKAIRQPLTLGGAQVQVGWSEARDKAVSFLRTRYGTMQRIQRRHQAQRAYEDNITIDDSHLAPLRPAVPARAPVTNPKIINLAKVKGNRGVPYWQKGAEIVMAKKGLPVIGSRAPKNGISMGRWKPVK
ncbi:MAG: hypothetical protein H0Z39_10040 [Peptococcaceae bacterium]|nr:hypothetical protein [Peptococcaceae bacterium]